MISDSGLLPIAEIKHPLCPRILDAYLLIEQIQIQVNMCKERLPQYGKCWGRQIAGPNATTHSNQPTGTLSPVRQDMCLKCSPHYWKSDPSQEKTEIDKSSPLNRLPSLQVAAPIPATVNPDSKSGDIHNPILLKSLKKDPFYSLENASTIISPHLRPSGKTRSSFLQWQSE